MMPMMLSRGLRVKRPSSPGGGWSPELYSGALFEANWASADGFAGVTEQTYAHQEGETDAQFATAGYDQQNSELGGVALAKLVPDPAGYFDNVVGISTPHLKGWSGGTFPSTWQPGDVVEWRAAGTQTKTGDGRVLVLEVGNARMGLWLFTGSGTPGSNDDIYNVTRDATWSGGSWLQTWAVESMGCKGSVNWTAAPHVWLKTYRRFRSGWSSVGAYPSPSANSRKLFFMMYDVGSRWEIEYSNTHERQAIHNMASTSEVALSGNTTGATNIMGRQDTYLEWSDEDWREVIGYWRRTSSTTGVIAWLWRSIMVAGVPHGLSWAQCAAARSGNTLLTNPYDFHCYAQSITRGGGVPQIRGFEIPGNRNRIPDVGTEIREYIGPTHVVDGAQAADPFGVLSLMGS